MGMHHLTWSSVSFANQEFFFSLALLKIEQHQRVRMLQHERGMCRNDGIQMRPFFFLSQSLCVHPDRITAVPTVIQGKGRFHSWRPVNNNEEVDVAIRGPTHYRKGDSSLHGSWRGLVDNEEGREAIQTEKKKKRSAEREWRIAFCVATQSSLLYRW